MTKRFIIALLLLLSVPVSLSAQEQDVLTITVNGVSFNMIRVEGGTFLMGDPSIPCRRPAPAHQETVSTYYIGETEVTEEMWRAVMGDAFFEYYKDVNNQQYFEDSLQLPVFSATYIECVRFIYKLKELTGRKFRLPTGAEWEYAARGGAKSRGYMYSGSNNIDEVACYNGQNLRRGHVTVNVKSKKPNELGIYDMSGNVAEWCNELYGDPNFAGYYVLRGGSESDHDARDCTPTSRYPGHPGFKYTTLQGFRLVLEL